MNVGAQAVPDGVQSLDGHILEAVGTSLHIAEDLVDTAPHRSQTFAAVRVRSSSPLVPIGSPPICSKSPSKILLLEGKLWPKLTETTSDKPRSPLSPPYSQHQTAMPPCASPPRCSFVSFPTAYSQLFCGFLAGRSERRPTHRNLEITTCSITVARKLIEDGCGAWAWCGWGSPGGYEHSRAPGSR